jgi:hypothetical protein
MRCADCKYFVPCRRLYSAGGTHENMRSWGECDRWKKGYDLSITETEDTRQVVVEGDEGWGAYVGPDFGCVLFEAREP